MSCVIQFQNIFITFIYMYELLKIKSEKAFKHKNIFI